MKKTEHQRVFTAGGIAIGIACLLVLSINTIHAQQFNSDNWLSKPHGTVTIIPTFGQRSSMLMNTYSLFPGWEITMAAYLYNNDSDKGTDDGYSTSFYLKYMFIENKSNTGGAAIKGGTGMFPGSISSDVREKDAFQTYWMNMPVTIPLYHNKVSVDLMPGFSMTKNYGAEEHSAWAFTYSTRVAWNPWGPNLSLVGEVFGSEGETGAIPEFKTGLRWDASQYATFALSYGQEFSDNHGAGFEFGVMLFTPPFACLAGCGKEPKESKKEGKKK